VALTERNAEQLTREAALAARIRALKVDPDVVALHVERVRTQVEWLTWISIGLGLLFTLVNVQQFAAADTQSWFVWCTAWLLDPMVSLALIAVLRAEMVTARYQLQLDGWAQACKWMTLAATYIMNTWSSWWAADPAQIILHSVPVATVFVVASAAPGIRDRLTEAVVRAAEEATRVGDLEQPEVIPLQAPAIAEVSVPEPVVVVPPPAFVPAPPATEEVRTEEPPAVEQQSDSVDMSPVDYLLSAWRFGRRVEASELYQRYPDKKPASLRAVMSQLRKKHPGLEPPVRTDEEVRGGKRTSKVG
jgi:hypothetical protein